LGAACTGAIMSPEEARDDVAVGVFDGCDQPSATEILLSVQKI